VFEGLRAVYLRMRGSTARNTGWMLLGYGVRIVVQAVAFVLLARALGAADFGQFAAALALVTLVTPFVELGSYSIVIRDISEGERPALAVGNTLSSAALVLPLGVASVVGLKFLFLPDVPWKMVAFVTIGGFLGTPLLNSARAAFVASGRIGKSAMIEILHATLFLLAVLLYIQSGDDVLTWAMFYASSGVFGGIVAQGWLTVYWGMPRPGITLARNRLLDGASFAIGLAAKGASADLDKAMLARLDTLSATGVYSAAHRVVSVAGLPLMALAAVLYPRFFTEGRKGYSRARLLAWRITPITFCYGLVAASVVWIAAPVIGSLLGEEFAEAVSVLRLLCAVLVVQALQTPFADALSGSGRQAVRSFGQVAAMVFGVALNLWLIPLYGILGAIVATVVTQTALLGFLVVFPAVYASRNERLFATHSAVR
jgi:O-antigen/teichoic acid export membrane protein